MVGAEKCGRAAADLPRISHSRSTRGRGLGGVSHGVVPPLINTQKQGSSSETEGTREGESSLENRESRGDGLDTISPVNDNPNPIKVSEILPELSNPLEAHYEFQPLLNLTWTESNHKPR
ncbi:hypothetical protein PUN28_000024 [Cardiocondyla obscurior]|uniref:Uncharacterized protein n=1 Tax=Cardiocondyla obscurior TaxID=286306 RepID=A0AAW2GXT9_9HYME